MKNGSTTLTFLLVLTSVSLAYSQTPRQFVIRPYIQTLVDSIGKGSFEGPNLNMMGRKPIPSDQFRRYETLCDSATTEELTYLTSDTSAVVRCYSFDALVQRKPEGFLRLALKHLSDRAAFKMRSFDVVDWETVSDYLKNVVLLKFFETNVPDTSQYTTIRNLSVSKEVPGAVIALAKFRKPQDIQVVSSYFSDSRLGRLALIATEEFPAEQLFDKVVEVRNKLVSSDFPSLDLCIPLYEAMVQYKTDETRSLLKESLSKTTGFAQSIQKIAIYVALTKYPGTYFQGVKALITLSPDEQQAADELLKR